MKMNGLKIASAVGIALGIAGTVVSSIVAPKQQAELINQKVAEALAERTKES